MEIITLDKFRVVKAEEGKILTTYNNGDDVRGYSSFTQCYVPLVGDIAHIKEITVAEDAVLCEQRDKLIENDNLKKYNG